MSPMEQANIGEPQREARFMIGQMLRKPLVTLTSFEKGKTY